MNLNSFHTVPLEFPSFCRIFCQASVQVFEVSCTIFSLPSPICLDTTPHLTSKPANLTIFWSFPSSMFRPGSRLTLALNPSNCSSLPYAYSPSSLVCLLTVKIFYQQPSLYSSLQDNSSIVVTSWAEFYRLNSSRNLSGNSINWSCKWSLQLYITYPKNLISSRKCFIYFTNKAISYFSIIFQ